MNLYVCVGSSCHLKGSYEVIEIFKEQIEKNNLKEKVSLKASFCLGHCTEGVTIKIDENEPTSVSVEEAEQFFIDNILSKF